MNNIDLYELEYANYLAEQEMLDQLAILSIKSHNNVLTESAIQSINEAAIDTVMNYIKKVAANIQVVWNKFKATITKGEYAALKKQYGKYFNSNTKIIADNNPSVCILAEVDKQLMIEMPVLSESLLNDLSGSTEDFIQKHLKDVYEENKSILDVMDSKVFKKQNVLAINSQSLKFYTQFMENYSSKVNKASEDIKNINNTSNIVKQILSKMTNNNTNNDNSQNTNNNTENNSEEKVNKESFVNIADTLLYYFTEEQQADFRSTNEPKNDNNSDTNNDDEKKEKSSDINKQIMNYYKVSTQLLSAKLNILNKARKNALHIIKEFGSTAKKESEGKTNNSNNATTNNVIGIEDLQINL